jgi:hypothetical protein
VTANNDLCICGLSNCGGHRCCKDSDGRFVIELPAGQMARIDADGHFWYGLYSGCHRVQKEIVLEKAPERVAYDFWRRFAIWRSFLDGVFRSLL